MSNDQYIIAKLSEEFVRVWVDFGPDGKQGEVTLTAVARDRLNQENYMFTFSDQLDQWFELDSGIIPESWRSSVINAFGRCNPERDLVKDFLLA